MDGERRVGWRMRPVMLVIFSDKKRVINVIMDFESAKGN